MANKVYPFSYDDENDKDIAEWLTGLPRTRKAAAVRNAIRFYLNSDSMDHVLSKHSKNSEIQEEASSQTRKKPSFSLDDLKATTNE